MSDSRNHPGRPRRFGPQLAENQLLHALDAVVNLGPLKVTADNQKDLPLSPILGGIALAG